MHGGMTVITTICLNPALDRTVTDEEYDAVLSWMMLNDLHGFVQEDSAADTGYIPEF